MPAIAFWFIRSGFIDPKNIFLHVVSIGAESSFPDEGIDVVHKPYFSESAFASVRAVVPVRKIQDNPRIPVMRFWKETGREGETGESAPFGPLYR